MSAPCQIQQTTLAKNHSIEISQDEKMMATPTQPKENTVGKIIIDVGITGSRVSQDLRPYSSTYKITYHSLNLAYKDQNKKSPS